jgi:hypothetical protein
MSETKTPQDYAAFLKSLKVNNDDPEKMHGYRFSEDLKIIKLWVDMLPMSDVILAAHYLIERCRRLQSNAKPSDLAEQVKKFMRAGMDAAISRERGEVDITSTSNYDYFEEFQRLSEGQ